jgi:hypothetical protein
MIWNQRPDASRHRPPAAPADSARSPHRAQESAHAGIIGDLEAPAEALTLGLAIGLHLYLGAMFLQAGQKPLRDTAIHIERTRQPG